MCYQCLNSEAPPKPQLVYSVVHIHNSLVFDTLQLHVNSDECSSPSHPSTTHNLTHTEMMNRGSTCSEQLGDCHVYVCDVY